MAIYTIEVCYPPVDLTYSREIWKLTPFHLSKCIFLIIQGIIFSKIGMFPRLDTLFLFQATQSLLFLLNAACLAEKQQIPI